MRAYGILGAILLLLGAAVLFRGLSYKEKHKVLEIGELKATVTERHQVPAWVGGVALVGGFAILVAATVRARTST